MKKKKILFTILISVVFVSVVLIISYISLIARYSSEIYIQAYEQEKTPENLYIVCQRLFELEEYERYRTYTQKLLFDAEYEGVFGKEGELCDYDEKERADLHDRLTSEYVMSYLLTDDYEDAKKAFIECFGKYFCKDAFIACLSTLKYKTDVFAPKRDDVVNLFKDFAGDKTVDSDIRTGAVAMYSSYAFATSDIDGMKLSEKLLNAEVIAGSMTTDERNRYLYPEIWQELYKNVLELREEELARALSEAVGSGTPLLSQ